VLDLDGRALLEVQHQQTLGIQHLQIILREIYSRPLKNHNAFAQGSVDLEGGAEIYYEAMFNRRDSSQNGIRPNALFTTQKEVHSFHLYLLTVLIKLHQL
jgi:hypothetical protein